MVIEVGYTFIAVFAVHGVYVDFGLADPAVFQLLFLLFFVFRIVDPR